MKNLSFSCGPAGFPSFVCGPPTKNVAHPCTTPTGLWWTLKIESTARSVLHITSGQVVRQILIMLKNYEIKLPAGLRMVEYIAICAGGLGFDSRAGPTGPQLVAAAMFLRSCVVQALSRWYEPRYPLHASMEHSKQNEVFILIVFGR